MNDILTIVEDTLTFEDDHIVIQDRARGQLHTILALVATPFLYALIRKTAKELIEEPTLTKKGHLAGVSLAMVSNLIQAQDGYTEWASSNSGILNSFGDNPTGVQIGGGAILTSMAILVIYDAITILKTCKKASPQQENQQEENGNNGIRTLPNDEECVEEIMV